MRKIAIRVDSSNKVGYGHLYRRFAIAEQLKQLGHSVTFICQVLPACGGKLLINSEYRVHWLDSNMNIIFDECADLASCEKIVRAHQYDAIFIDHYQIGEIWERRLRLLVKLIVVIDDLANRKHCCDFLIDYIFNRTNADYTALVPKEAKLLIAGQYALLRQGLKG